MVGYMMIPMGLTFEQQHIYILLYSKCDFNTMTVKYTVDQLITDSHKGFELTVKKVRNIIKFLADNNYIEVVKRGSKGNPTIYKINKIKELNEENGQLKGNQRATIGQLKDNQNGSTMPIIEEEGQLKGNNRAVKGQLKGNPIKEKEKEKEKDIYIENQNSVSVTYMDLSFIDSLIDKVKITEREYKLLTERYSKKLVHAKIKALDGYNDIDKFGRHVKVLNSWCDKDKDKDKEEYKDQPQKKRPKKDPYAALKDDYTEDKYAYLKPKDPPDWVKDWT